MTFDDWLKKNSSFKITSFEHQLEDIMEKYKGEIDSEEESILNFFSFLNESKNSFMLYRVITDIYYEKYTIENIQLYFASIDEELSEEKLLRYIYQVDMGKINDEKIEIYNSLVNDDLNKIEPFIKYLEKLTVFESDIETLKSVINREISTSYGMNPYYYQFVPVVNRIKNIEDDSFKTYIYGKNKYEDIVKDRYDDNLVFNSDQIRNIYKSLHLKNTTELVNYFGDEEIVNDPTLVVSLLLDSIRRGPFSNNKEASRIIIDLIRGLTDKIFIESISLIELVNRIYNSTERTLKSYFEERISYFKNLDVKKLTYSYYKEILELIIIQYYFGEEDVSEIIDHIEEFQSDLLLLKNGIDIIATGLDERKDFKRYIEAR